MAQFSVKIMRLTGSLLSENQQKAALVFDASVDDATKTAAKHAQLTTLGIIPRDTA